MKKLFICLFLTGAIAASLVSAQNFLDNDHQKAGREFEKQATVAMEAGDYDKAAQLADMASAEYRLSKEYADTQSLKFKAANAITLAQQAIDLTVNTARAKAVPKQMAEAKSLLKQAKDLYAAEKWADSREKAMKSLDIINALADVNTTPSATAATDGVTLPLYYVVVRRPANTDCFWNIAKMPEIYNNPHQWSRLYQANKAKLRNPENPNLLHPGTILEIPALNGEKREGTYDPAKHYQNISE